MAALSLRSPAETWITGYFHLTGLITNPFFFFTLIFIFGLFFLFSLDQGQHQQSNLFKSYLSHFHVVLDLMSNRNSYFYFHHCVCTVHSTVVIIQYWQHVTRRFLGEKKGRLMNNRSKPASGLFSTFSWTPEQIFLCRKLALQVHI